MTTRTIHLDLRDDKQTIEQATIDHAQDLIAEVLEKAGREDLVYFYFDTVYEAALTSYNKEYKEHWPGELAFELAQCRSRLKLKMAGKRH